MTQSSGKFWLVQFIIWGGFSLLNLAIRTYFIGFEVFEVINSIALLISLLVASGWLRAQFTNQVKSSFPQTMWVALKQSAMASSGALVILAITLLPTQVIVFDSVQPQSYSQLFADWPNLLFFLFCWSVVYLLLKHQRELKSAKLKQEKLNSELKEAEFALMHNQLNPHFIFNVINNIRAQILEDQEGARDSLTQLSEVLRTLLSNHNNTLWSLDEELQLCHDYIALNKLQLEQRLHVEWENEGNLDAWNVPQMVVQLLIENAIKHGVSVQPNGGAISIRIKASERSLKILVSNPGTLATNSSSGIGLNNIRQRLEALYSDNAKLTIENRSNVVCAEIELNQNIHLNKLTDEN